MAPDPGRLVDYFVVSGVGDAPEEFSRRGTVDASADATPREVVAGVAYKPMVIDRAPLRDHLDSPFPVATPLFCFPGGIRARPSPECPFPSVLSFVMTGGDGTKLYGSSFVFYEEYEPPEPEPEALQDAQLAFDQQSNPPKQPLSAALKSRASFKSRERGSSRGSSTTSQTTGLLSPTADSSTTNSRMEGSDTPTHSRLPTTFKLNRGSVSDKDGHSDNINANGRSSLASRTNSMAPGDKLFLPKAIAVLSRKPFFSMFEDFLEALYRLTQEGQCRLPVERYIAHFLFAVPLPSPSTVVEFMVGDRLIALSQSPSGSLPSLHLSMEHLFQNLDPENVLTVYVAILLELKVLLITKRIEILTPIAETLIALLFPLTYQSVYIPILPRSLIQYLSVPVPFIIGVHPSFIKHKKLQSDVVVVNLDNNSVECASWSTRTGRSPNLPQSIQDNLISAISKHASVFGSPTFSIPVGPDGSVAGGGGTGFGGQARNRNLSIDTFSGVFSEKDLRAAFFDVMCDILRDYRDFLVKPSKSMPAPLHFFHRSDYILHHPESYRPFLEQFFETQTFAHFGHQRVTSDIVSPRFRVLDATLDAKRKSLQISSKSSTQTLSSTDSTSASSPWPPVPPSPNLSRPKSTQSMKDDLTDALLDGATKSSSAATMSPKSVDSKDVQMQVKTPLSTSTITSPNRLTGGDWVLLAPEPSDEGLPKDTTYEYTSFPRLNHSLLVVPTRSHSHRRSSVVLMKKFLSCEGCKIL